MKITSPFIKSGLLLGFVCVVVACVKSPDCDVTPTGKMLVKCYSKADSTTLIVRFVTISAVGSDSVFYNASDSLSSFNLQLNEEVDATTFVFATNTSTDTIEVGYVSTLEWLSEECGPSFSFSELRLLNSTFSSELISSVLIDKVSNENIRIYY